MDTNTSPGSADALLWVGSKLVDLVRSVAGAERSVVAEIDNYTDLRLTKLHDEHKHGGFGVLPRAVVDPKSRQGFSSQKNIGFFGTEGWLVYSLEDGANLLFYWSVSHSANDGAACFIPSSKLLNTDTLEFYSKKENRSVKYGNYRCGITFSSESRANYNFYVFSV